MAIDNIHDPVAIDQADEPKIANFRSLWSLWSDDSIFHNAKDGGLSTDMSPPA
jgi:hypothetical protein